MKKIALVLFAGGLLAACSGDKFPEIKPLTLDQSNVSAFDATYASGKDLMRTDHPGLAAVTFAKATLIDPQSVAALNATGASFDELHAPALAAPWYQRAIVIEPRSSDTLNNMALSAALAGDRARSLALFERALAIDPENAAIRANLAVLTTPPPSLPIATPDGPTVDLPAPSRPQAPTIARMSEARLQLTMPGDAEPGAVKSSAAKIVKGRIAELPQKTQEIARAGD
jgi:Tfp pilus assembly protein PilF